jgi:hypothetical protein
VIHGLHIVVAAVDPETGDGGWVYRVVNDSGASVAGPFYSHDQVLRWGMGEFKVRTQAEFTELHSWEFRETHPQIMSLMNLEEFL